MKSGGRSYNVQTGRRDGTVSLAQNVNLPAPSDSISGAISQFASKGLNTTDFVILLGNRPFILICISNKSFLLIISLPFF